MVTSYEFFKSLSVYTLFAENDMSSKYVKTLKLSSIVDRMNFLSPPSKNGEKAGNSTQTSKLAGE